MRAERLKPVSDDVVAGEGPLRGPTARVARRAAPLWFPVSVLLPPGGIKRYKVENERRLQSRRKSIWYGPTTGSLLRSSAPIQTRIGLSKEHAREEEERLETLEKELVPGH